ncbi:superoxide dismutase family protein [Rhodococcus sp. HNM0569]|uniref:superoxide dismutase[Cu-Zn] n=1 Tax=Rhodococcus sp. HNM0569 TaxID=2716340 RepID=UPI00146C2DBF|nr:superoxide dismutase family protein [Rhodococcus sp. HNM0569]NLU83147.1 superoxide dismutase family protein [Rhodococcus sp. HNM0569]
MYQGSPRRKLVRYATPLVALAAVALTGCSNSEEATDEPGTTPPVWTGAADPGAGGHGAGESGHGSGAAESEGALTTTLQDPQGAEVGTATFTESGDHVEVTVSVEGLTPGFHGLHVHQVGKCEANSTAPTGGAPGAFLSAGGHLQVEGHTGHPASGDLTSLQVREDGTAELTTTTSSFTVEDLRNGGSGTALMVHANADNFANIPTRYAPAPDQETMSTGDAGGRVACGVVGAE